MFVAVQEFDRASIIAIFVSRQGRAASYSGAVNRYPKSLALAAGLISALEKLRDDTTVVHSASKATGRPPLEPRRVRLAIWSPGSGMTAVMPRERRCARCPREE